MMCSRNVEKEHNGEFLRKSVVHCTYFNRHAGSATSLGFCINFYTRGCSRILFTRIGLRIWKCDKLLISQSSRFCLVFNPSDPCDNDDGRRTGARPKSEVCGQTMADQVMVQISICSDELMSCIKCQYPPMSLLNSISQFFFCGTLASFIFASCKENPR